MVLFNPELGVRGVITFPMGISPRVSGIALLEFELAYSDVVVQHFNHYTTRTSLEINQTIWKFKKYEKKKKILTLLAFT